MEQCISGELLQDVVRKSSDYYTNKGYITTKPYIKSQYINDGQIDIAVLEGRISNIIDAESKKSNNRISTAFIGQKGALLNLKRIETTLESMNRLPSFSSSFNILPGKDQGSSIIEIKTEKTVPYHLSLGLSRIRWLKTTAALPTHTSRTAIGHVYSTIQAGGNITGAINHLNNGNINNHHAVGSTSLQSYNGNVAAYDYSSGIRITGGDILSIAKGDINVRTQVLDIPSDDLGLFILASAPNSNYLRVMTS